tara:strand:+ start:140 stop:394 length:255 start_codon:yes stop_codon:yes gene_type:complete
MASFRDLPSELQASIFSLKDKMMSYRDFLYLLEVGVPTKLDMSLWGYEEWEAEITEWNKDNEEEGFFIDMGDDHELGWCVEVYM